MRSSLQIRGMGTGEVSAKLAMQNGKNRGAVPAVAIPCRERCSFLPMAPCCSSWSTQVRELGPH